MAKRDYPSNYFAWYNDDRRVAILELDTTSTSGEKTKEKYDTYQSDSDVANGLRITYHSKYEAVSTSNLTSQMSTGLGIDTGLQECIASYVKARLYEDMGDLQKAQYFRAMYEKELKKYPSRKSGVRALSVPHM